MVSDAESLPDPLDVKRRLLAQVMIEAGREPDERHIARMPEDALTNALNYYTSAIHVG